MNLENLQFIILIKLFLAHFISDFIIQPDSWVKNRQEKALKSPYLYLHSFIAGVLSYLLIARWQWWYLPLIVFVVHVSIDIWKVYQKNNSVRLFLIDQGAHILSIVVIWLAFVGGWCTFGKWVITTINSLDILLLLFGYVIILWPSGILIRELTARWRKQIEQDEQQEESLNKAGMWIGFLERFLTLTLIVINQFGAIGFLIAAKSILRLNPNDANKTRKYTEYVLLGTLISFSITIIVGLLLRGTVDILPQNK